MRGRLFGAAPGLRVRGECATSKQLPPSQAQQGRPGRFRRDSAAFYTSTSTKLSIIQDACIHLSHLSHLTQNEWPAGPAGRSPKGQQAMLASEKAAEAVAHAQGKVRRTCQPVQSIMRPRQEYVLALPGGASVCLSLATDAPIIIVV